MEIEAKYRLAEPTSAEQIEALDWRPFRLGMRGEAEQVDTIWDTADRRLSAARHAVRLRQGGKQALVTIKGPGSVRSGVHEREELEQPATQLEPAGWPAEIKQRLHELIGDEPLQPLFAIRNHRRTWPLLDDGRIVGEVALDRGSIEAGGRSQPLHELEVELKGDAVRQLLSTVAGLVLKQLPAEPEDRSKFERGIALLQS